MSGSIFRSELMELCQLFLSSEAAYGCVSELGELGCIQFRDLNPDVNSFQRKFVNEVRRCDEMERKLRYIERQLIKAEIPVLDTGENPPAPPPREMVDLEAILEKLEGELTEVNSNAEALDRNFLELTELKCVLESAQLFLDPEQEGSGAITQTLLTPEEGLGPIQLGFVAGVVGRERLAMFERMMWRVSRGNAFLRHQDIPYELKDPATGHMVRKSVYLVFFQGEQLKIKVRKICEGCRSTLYPCPDTPAERQEMMTGVTGRLADLNMVLSQTTEHRERVLASASKQLRVWLIKVRKIKAIYHTLNMFNVDVTNKCLIAEGWMPLEDLQPIKEALRRGTESSGSSFEPILNMIPTGMSPPSYHRTNKFTSAFQALIDAYGVGTYREVNPGLFTCATFPFLFAVMFGDMGHGTIMFLFALWMVLKEDTLHKVMAKTEIPNMFFKGRYIILLMGMFSIYTGFIYNDVFSKSFNIFGSAWMIGSNGTRAVIEEGYIEYMLNPADREDYVGSPYAMGLDPMWQLAVNKIAFQNSYKMKISIIIGVLHMIFGVCLSIVNHLHFKRTLNIIVEFIPQLYFLFALFGYLCVMIFHKWVNYGDGPGFDVVHGTSCAPSILITFINMVLMKSDPVKDDCESNFMFPGQFVIQSALVVTALLCVPILLLPKPIVLRYRANAKLSSRPLVAVTVQEDRMSITASTASLASNGSASAAAAPLPGEEEEEFIFSDALIYQGIHTIEYVLGSVSHTASYLRLWALSLAHAQLSEVLWNMVFKIGIQQGSYLGAIMLYVIFAAWAVLTIAILVLMEGLSAFLHTLRLHWVEFCSKFYEAQGYIFTPFTFKNFVEDEPED